MASRVTISEFAALGGPTGAELATLPCLRDQAPIDVTAAVQTSNPVGVDTRYVRIISETRAAVRVGSTMPEFNMVLPANKPTYFGITAGMTISAAIESVTVLDTATYPDDRYAAGSYLAFQAVNDQVSPRSQNMVVYPISFQHGVVFNWTWPVGADNSVKSFNAVNYGNYLNTDVPVPITGVQLTRLDVLKVKTRWTWSMPVDSANITMDFFLYNAATSTAPNMLCEFQIFYHTPDSTKAFVDSVTNLGTYTSPAVDGTPAIAWKAARQASNFFGTPYYLFYPADQSDKLDMTFDIKAALNWLMAPNPTTSVTYLTGNEYFNGLGTGIETLKKTGAATLQTYNVSYSFAPVPPIPPTLPPNTNLIPVAARADFTNSFWVAQQVTAQTLGYTETATTNVHGMGVTFGNPIAVAASTVYVFFVDVDVSAGQPWIFLQIQTNDFASDVQAYFNPATLSIAAVGNSGGFTLPTTNIALLTTGKTRLYLGMRTAATTPVFLTIRSATAVSVTNYAGSTSKSVALANPFFYT